MALTASDVDTSKQGQHATRLKSVEMALEALYNVLRANAGVEVQCMGHFKLLFSLLRMQGANKLQMCALQVNNIIYTCTCNYPMYTHVHVVLSYILCIELVYIMYIQCAYMYLYP